MKINSEVRLKEVDLHNTLYTYLYFCIHVECHYFRDCFGVIDCEWCQLDFDGVTPLNAPFCANQRVCFAGVMGGSTPYHDEIKGQ